MKFDRTQYKLLMTCEKEKDERIKTLETIEFPKDFPILQNSAIVVFGSTAHGLCFTESDIDMCTIYDDRGILRSVFQKERKDFIKRRKELEKIVKTKKNVECTFKCGRLGSVLLPKSGKRVLNAVSNGVKFLYSYCISRQDKFDEYRSIFFNSCKKTPNLHKIFLSHRGIHNCFVELGKDFSKGVLKPKLLRNSVLFLSQALKIEYLKEKGRAAFIDTIEDLVALGKLKEKDAFVFCEAMERSLSLQKETGSKEKSTKIDSSDKALTQQILEFHGNMVKCC